MPHPAQADPSRLAQHVFETLRAQIIGLDRLPGSTLSRGALQSEFGASSTPVRDALMRLQEENLVEVYPQRATVVSLIDLYAARQAQFLRRGIEQEAVRLLACDPDPGLLAALDAAIAAQEEFARQGDDAAFAQADRDLHRLLVEAAGAPDLWPMLRRASGHIDRIRRLQLPGNGKAARIVEDHREIAAAIAAGRPMRALRAMNAHLSRTVADWDSLRADHPGHFAPARSR